MNNQPTKSTGMKAIELRLNNYVIDESYIDRICTVKGIYEDQIEVALETGISFYSDPQQELIPVPLTEQWLIDFGFDYDYITADLKDFSVGHYADGFYFLPTNKIDFRIGQELKHVHQLQNLFYSLTGKELIKK